MWNHYVHPPPDDDEHHYLTRQTKGGTKIEFRNVHWQASDFTTILHQHRVENGCWGTFNIHCRAPTWEIKPKTSTHSPGSTAHQRKLKFFNIQSTWAHLYASRIFVFFYQYRWRLQFYKRKVYQMINHYKKFCSVWSHIWNLHLSKKPWLLHVYIYVGLFAQYGEFFWTFTPEAGILLSSPSHPHLSPTVLLRSIFQASPQNANHACSFVIPDNKERRH